MKKRILIFVIFLFTFFIFPEKSLGAVYTLNPVQKGNLIEVKIFLNTEGKEVNALDGVVSFFGPVAVKEIYDGKSKVAVWIKKPSEREKGKISFSGIIPGGTKEEGEVFTLYFTVLKTGKLEMATEGTAYINDGTGGSLLMSETKVTLAVSFEKEKVDEITLPSDTTLPRITEKIIAQNEAMFEGKPFLIVRAKDDESGVSDISFLSLENEGEVENLKDDERFRVIEIPHPLLDSDMTSFLYVQVRDRAGNAIVAEVSSPEALISKLSPFSFENWFRKWWGFCILIVLLLLAGFFARRIIRRHGSFS
ncbi:MAG: hypothetical protein AAB545_00900 [Patescibacteria group bacterium]